MSVKIIGSGIYVPSVRVSNKDLIEKHNLDTTDEWITVNTGIHERGIAVKETTAYMAEMAAAAALHDAQIAAWDVDLLIVATATPSMLSPSTACIVKGQLGMDRAVAFDISAVCSGWLFGASIAEQYISSGMYKTAVVVGADKFSTITDWNHKHSIFFGDGAGATVLRGGYNNGFGKFHLGSDSKDATGFYCEHGKTFVMNTRDVYNSATRLIPLAIRSVLERADMVVEDVDYIVPHQPSKRILTDVADNLGVHHGRVLMNMRNYANTVAGTIPILYHETRHLFNPGDNIVFAAIGSGWTYGAATYTA